SKVAAEHECLKAVADGLDVVVATSCAIVGPNDFKPSRMGRVLLDFARGRLRAYIPGGFEFVAARDIVEGHRLAMDKGRAGQRYIFSTSFQTVDELMAIFQRVPGRASPRPALRRDPVGLLLGGHARFGGVFSLRLPGARATALIGPRAQAAFFGATEDHLSAREVYRFTVPIFGKGVVYDASPEVMDEQMGLLFPALRDDRLSAYARAMQDEAERHVAAWGDEGEVDLLAALNELTVFIASRCLVGAEFRARLSRDLAHLFHDLER